MIGTGIDPIDVYGFTATHKTGRKSDRHKAIDFIRNRIFDYI